MATKYKCSCGKKGCMKCGGKLSKLKNGGKLPKYQWGTTTEDPFGGTATSLDYSFGEQSITNSQGGANAGHYTGTPTPYNTDYVAPASVVETNSGTNTTSSGGNVNYLAAGVAATQGISNYANISKDPNASEVDKAKSFSSGITGTIGAANPVVGTFIGLGNSIFEPMRDNAEQFDDQGNLINEGKARRSGIVGGLLSPSQALGYRKESGNWFDVGGKKYVNWLEEEKKKELGITDPNQKTASINPYDANGNLDPRGAIAQGKQHQKAIKTFDAMRNAPLNPQTRVKPQVDDTLGWMKFGGNLDVFNYNGNSHAQGGIDVNAQGLPTKQFGGQPVAEVEGGETMAKLEQGGNTPFIFSDKLKSLSSKKTFAELHKPLVNMEKRMTKNAERVSSNPISRESQERMKERIMNNTKALAQEQEHMKMMKDMGKTNVMKNGGKLPKYDGTSTQSSFIPYDDSAKMVSPYTGPWLKPLPEDDSAKMVSPYNYGTESASYKTSSPTPYNPDYQAQDSVLDTYAPPKGQGINWGNVAGTAMNNIGPAMQIAYQNQVANQKLNKDMFPEIQNPRTAEMMGELDKSKGYLDKYFGYDIKEQLAELDRTGRASMENTRNVSRGSANVALAHDYGTRSRTTAAKNQLRERYENAEKAKNLQASDAYMKYANMLGLLGDTERQVKQGQEDRYSGALANQTKYRDAMYSNIGKLSEENQREKYQWAALDDMSQYYKIDKNTGKRYFDAEAYNKANPK